MFWHALHRDAAPRTQILVPPATWNLQADDAQAILTALATTIRSGLAVPATAAGGDRRGRGPHRTAGARWTVTAPERGRFDDDGHR